MASPNSFIRFFNCWSTNPPSRRIFPYWMQVPPPTHPLRGILNLEIGKIESDDECLYRPETGHCGAGCRKADQRLSDLRSRTGRGAGDPGAFRRRSATALARDYGLCFPGVCSVWGGGVGEGVSGLSRRKGGLEPGSGCRRLHAGVWLVWPKLVLESATAAKTEVGRSVSE